MQRATLKRAHASSQGSPTSDAHAHNDYVPAPQTPSSAKKRSLSGISSDLRALFSPAAGGRQATYDDNVMGGLHANHHHDFTAVLDDSRMSDDSWPVGGSFVDEEDMSSREKFEASWPDEHWGPSESLLSNEEHSKLLAGESLSRLGNYLSSPLKSKRPATDSISHTPLSSSYPTLNNEFSTRHDGMAFAHASSNSQLSPSAPSGIFRRRQDKTIVPYSSPVTRLSEAAGIDVSRPMFGATSNAQRSLSSPTYSSSSLDSSDHDSHPPLPASMHVKLGRSTQSVFENINRKLKAKPNVDNYATIPSADTHSNLPPWNWNAVDPLAHSHPMEMQHSMHKMGTPIPSGGGHAQPPAGVAVAVRQRPPSVQRLPAVKPPSQASDPLTSTSMASSPAETTTEPLPQPRGPSRGVVSTDRGDKEKDAKKPDAPPQVKCKCKKSKCLRLYCDCFSQGAFCNSCNCNDCHNLPLFKAYRDAAVREVLAKNPEAFKPRIDTKSHSMGCRCKKSQCLKKYCECFEARVLCSEKCKCAGCLNQAGSQPLIDKRRKMKDRVGTQFAIEESEKKWKSQGAKNQPSAARSNSSSTGTRRRSAVPYLTADNKPAQPQYPPYMVPSYAYHPSHMYLPYGTPFHGHFAQTPQQAFFSADRAASAISWGHHRPTTPSSLMSSTVMSPLESSRRNARTVISITKTARAKIGPEMAMQANVAAPPETAFFGPGRGSHSRATIASVLSFLPGNDIKRSRLVCKLWKGTIESFAT